MDASGGYGPDDRWQNWNLLVTWLLNHARSSARCELVARPASVTGVAEKLCMASVPRRWRRSPVDDVHLVEAIPPSLNNFGSRFPRKPVLWRLIPVQARFCSISGDDSSSWSRRSAPHHR